jgi:hypothetical protein
MRHLSYLLLLVVFVISCKTDIYRDKDIQYSPVRLKRSEKRILEKSLVATHLKYDEAGKMLTRELDGYNYHTDAQSGLFHEVRSSLSYAVILLDLGGRKNRERAFDIIEKTISLQDTVSDSPTCGVWPYYEEEPLATKKSPVDYNWADFNAVSLLEVYLGHQNEIPEELKAVIKNSIILAARSIQKRDVGPGYTNIAIMGTYVTYLTSHLFGIPDMQDYSVSRLEQFYDYTIEKGGFSEYNSPTYTIVALDELERMKQHIVNPGSKMMIDSLYSIGWKIIAYHYHIPTGQWAGPHSRSYSTLVRPSFYGLLNQASGGEIDTGMDTPPGNVKIRHEIPSYLMPFFQMLVFPRIENDLFEPAEPEITGTSYMTDRYVFSSANRSSLWNQRRPFLVYWGDIKAPYYLQVRFLHDMYDFSSACFYSKQNLNSLLAAINFITNGGDKHISIDRIKDGKFNAADLRLRFEFGNANDSGVLSIPGVKDEIFSVVLDDMQFNIRLYYSVFDEYDGHWEKGGDGTNSWIDYVIYSGPEKEIDMKGIDEALIGFTFSVGSGADTFPEDDPEVFVKENLMEVTWDGMNLVVPVIPGLQPKNL